jgi:hypothetical protein
MGGEPNPLSLYIYTYIYIYIYIYIRSYYFRNLAVVLIKDY